MANQADPLLLEARGLACARGGVPVVEGIDLALAAGSALMLTGPNGSGKTTLLRTIAGLQPALAGVLMVAGEGAAYGGHADAVKATLTVGENLAFWAEIHGAGSHLAALAALHLGPLANRVARDLSAGQRRRLGLARMLVTGRRLWLLDEPTVSLDLATVALFAGVMQAHLAAGGAVLLASHIDPGLDAGRLDLGPFRARSAGVLFAEGVA